MRTQLTIKIHIAKFKMMEHQVQNIPMKMIQNTQKYAKLLQFPTLCSNLMQQLYPNFIHQILPVDEIAKSINYLNSKQREVLNVVNTWAWCWTRAHIYFRQWRDREILFYESNIQRPLNLGRTSIHSGLGIKPETKLQI